MIKGQNKTHGQKHRHSAFIVKDDDFTVSMTLFAQEAMTLSSFSLKNLEQQRRIVVLI